MWGVTAQPAEQWPLTTANAPRETAVLGKRKPRPPWKPLSETEHQVQLKKKQWAKFYPPFIWIMRARVLLDVFYQTSVRQEGLPIHRNKRTSSSQIQNDPLQVLSLSFGGKVLKKGNLKVKYSKKGANCVICPALPALIFLSSGRTCMENASWSV